MKIIKQTLQNLEPFTPLAVVQLIQRHQASNFRNHETRVLAQRRSRLESLTHEIPETINRIRRLDRAQCTDIEFLQDEFIPSLGLNDEGLNEQPAELLPYTGRGLHLWQYPIQLAPYLAWVARNAEAVTSFLEIGCRWGGMFILISEWLQQNGANLQSIATIDPLQPSPLITEYFKSIQNSGIETTYLQDYSSSAQSVALIDRLQPDFVFIDGDHSLQGALCDHMLIRRHADIIVHHDIHSQSCPQTTLLWSALKELEARSYSSVEFIDQYPGVNGQFLGIGAMKRLEADPVTATAS